MQIAATARRDYHVTPDGAYWKVTKEGEIDPQYVGLTKIEATAAAIDQARLGKVSVVLHGRDGRIQSVWSYDNWTGPRDAWYAGVTTG